jgi:hypothetical protein
MKFQSNGIRDNYRFMNLKSAQNYLRSLSPDLLDQELGGLNAALKDAGFDRDVETSESEPPPEGYGHPYFWSPFIIVG